MYAYNICTDIYICICTYKRIDTYANRKAPGRAEAEAFLVASSTAPRGETTIIPLKSSFKGDIGPYKDYIRLYWK